jgi:ABC-type transport system substrate-binding protein
MNLCDCTWRDPGGVEAAQIICAFLDRVGIAVEIQPIDGNSFVPGLTVVSGAIRIDPSIAAFPGDLLHEAGHIAVADPGRRSAMADVGADPAEEMAAIAWSVAAARACDIPLSVLFHPEGYKGGSESLIENFSEGRTFGVPLLAWWGMTNEHGADGAIVFPAMARWLR